MPHRLTAAALILSTLALAAFAPAGQPDPKRRPNFLNPDIDFAMRELCFPWVKGEAGVEALAARQGVIEDKAKRGLQTEARVWWVGSADVGVAMEERPNGTRMCTVRVTRGDPVKLRAALDGAMAGWRVTLTPSVHRFAPGAYASRDVLCAPKDGPQDSLMVSTGRRGAPVPMMLTLMTGEPRDRRCDTAE